MTFVCCQKFYCFSRFLFLLQHKIKEESGHGDAVTPLSLFIYVRICRQSGSKWDVYLSYFSFICSSYSASSRSPMCAKP